MCLSENFGRMKSSVYINECKQIHHTCTHAAAMIILPRNLSAEFFISQGRESNFHEKHISQLQLPREIFLLDLYITPV